MKEPISYYLHGVDKILAGYEFMAFKPKPNMDELDLLKALGFVDIQKINFEVKTDSNGSTKLIHWGSERKGKVLVMKSNSWLTFLTLDYVTVSPEIQRSFNGIGTLVDAFWAWVGDSDDSFGYKYYKDGENYREYFLLDDFGKVEIKKNKGNFLLNEAEFLKEDNPAKTVQLVAESLGIVLNDYEESQLYEHDIDKVVDLNYFFDESEH